MKFAIIFIIVGLALAFLVSRIINMSSRMQNQEKVALQTEIYYKKLENYSMANARLVNTSLSSKNSPVRPEQESFFDGIVKEIGRKREFDSPESKLLNIRCVAVDNLLEDCDGAL